MKKEIAKRWVKELRSGKWNKGFNSLCVEDDNGECSFCCLGVLTEMYIEEKNKELPENKRLYWYRSGNYKFRELLFDGCVIHLHPDVINWSGMQSSFGDYLGDTLINLNDTTSDFTKVANAIEKHWKEL